MVRFTTEQDARIEQVRAAIAKHVHRVPLDNIPLSTIIRWLVERGLRQTEQEFDLNRGHDGRNR